MLSSIFLWLNYKMNASFKESELGPMFSITIHSLQGLTQDLFLRAFPHMAF